VFHTSLGVNTVGLSGVFGKIGVDELDDIESDGGSENSGENNFFVGDFEGVIGVEN